MTDTFRMSRIMMLGAALLLLTGLNEGYAQQAQRAKLVRVQNLVKLRRDAGSGWVKAALPAHSSLYARDEVQTYQKSRARVVMDATPIDLAPLTHVVIPPKQQGKVAGSPSRLNLLTGKLLLWLIGARPIEIGTAGATAAARGTQLLIETDETGRTVLTVIEGTVDFFNELGRVTVGANQQSIATPTTAPTRPMQVDPSSYLEWEASLDSLWMGYEKLYNPAAGRQALQAQLDAARQRAATGDAAAQVAYADLLHDLGDLNAAEEAYNQPPLDETVALKLGYNMLAQGRTVEAAEMFRQAGPGATALAGQAVALAGTTDEANLARAEQLAAQALAAEPANVEAQITAGLVAIRGGKADAAAQALGQVTTDYRGPAYLALVQTAQSQPQAAADSARRAVQMAPGSALAHESLGTALFYAGDLDGAAAEAKTALDLNPASPIAELLASDVAVARGDLQEGLQAAEAALALDPQQAPAWQRIAMIELTRNNLRRAAKGFGKALELQPKLVAAQTGMGMTYARQGHLAEALQAQQAAVALDPNQAAAHNNLGVVYLQTGKLAEAIAEFQRALELQPDWALVYSNLALSYLEGNRFAEAVRAGERAVQLGERSARTYSTLARVYLRQSRVNKAWAALRKALENDPDYALARMHLAEVYTRLGRAQEAQRERLRAIALQPSVIVDNRSYARTEALVAGGDGVYAQLRTSGRSDDGATSYFLAADHEEDNLDRSRTDYETQGLLGIVGQQTSADNTASLIVSASRDERHLPGRLRPNGRATDPNYLSQFEGQEFNLLTRSPLGQDTGVTFKAGYRRVTQRDTNPDAGLGDPKPFRHLRLDQRGPLMELRLDHDLGARSDLTAGFAVARERRAVAGLLAASSTLTPFENLAYRDVISGYVEYQRRLDPRTRLLAGLRVAAADDMKPVSRPKVSLRRQISRDGTLVLLTRPLLADDVTEVSPVDHWALRPWQSPLDLARGGFSQSYELQYELQRPSGSLLRVALFHRDVRNLLVDLENPAWAPGAAPVVLGAANLQGVEAEWERWLGQDLSAGVWARWTDSENEDAGGRDLPYQPELVGQARLDYLNTDGWRVGLIWQHVGKRYADLANAARLGSYGTLNASIARQFNLHTDAFVTVENVLGKEYEYYEGYPERDRHI